MVQLHNSLFRNDTTSQNVVTISFVQPRVKSNAGSPDVERCKYVKSRATTVYFRLGRLRRVSTYVQQMWGIIGHVTVEAGNAVGTDGAPPQVDFIPQSGT